MIRSVEVLLSDVSVRLTLAVVMLMEVSLSVEILSSVRTALVLSFEYFLLLITSVNAFDNEVSVTYLYFLCFL